MNYEQTLHSTLSTLHFIRAFRLRFAPLSGFPLYLCSLKFHLTQKFPLSVVRCLLSVVCCPTKLAKDAAPIPNALGAANSKVLTQNNNS